MSIDAPSGEVNVPSGGLFGAKVLGLWVDRKYDRLLENQVKGKAMLTVILGGLGEQKL